MANRQDPISKLRRTVGNASGVNKYLASKGLKPMEDQTANIFAKRDRAGGVLGLERQPSRNFAPVKKAAVKKAAVKKAAVKKATPVKKATSKKATAPARRVSTRKPPAPKNYGKSSGGSRSTTRRASY